MGNSPRPRINRHIAIALHKSCRQLAVLMSNMTHVRASCVMKMQMNCGFTILDVLGRRGFQSLRTILALKHASAEICTHAFKLIRFPIFQQLATPQRL
jgi:hypothetical protein